MRIQPTPGATAEPKPGQAIKLCRDCRWYRRTWSGFDDCRHSNNVRTDYVTGEKLPGFYGADSLRRIQNLCGPEAAWWEAKLK